MYALGVFEFTHVIAVAVPILIGLKKKTRNGMKSYLAEKTEGITVLNAAKP